MEKGNFYQVENLNYIRYDMFYMGAIISGLEIEIVAASRDFKYELNFELLITCLLD